MLTSPHTIRLSLLLTFLFMIVGAVVLVTGQHLSMELGIAVSVITFIYGFFLNFMLNMAQNKFFRFMQAFGEFSGSLLSFYKLVELFQSKSLTREAGFAINGLLERLDYLKPDRYSATHDDYFRLYDIAGKLKVNSKEQHNYLNRILSSLHDAGKTREVMETYANSYLRRGLTEVYWVFTGLFVITLVLLISSWETFIFSTVLIFLVLFISFVISDIDHLHYGSSAIRHSTLAHVKRMVNGTKR